MKVLPTNEMREAWMRHRRIMADAVRSLSRGKQAKSWRLLHPGRLVRVPTFPFQFLGLAERLC